MLEEIDKIKNDSSSIAVIYESPKRIIKTLELLAQYLTNSQICLCNDLTKKFERKYYGSINKVLEVLKENANNELGEYVLVIEKESISVEETNESICVEAKLIDIMIKNNISLKEAIKVVSESDKNISHKQIYDASLKLKEMFNKE
jgi:16S rRNA (cytidine1402-2'-O)-methyltransferase